MSQKSDDVKRLLDAMTDVDDRFVQEALHTGRIRKHNKKARVLRLQRAAVVIAAAAACGVIAAAAGRFGLMRSGNSASSLPESGQSAETDLETEEESIPEESGESGTQSESDLTVASTADADNAGASGGSGDGTLLMQSTGTAEQNTAEQGSGGTDAAGRSASGQNTSGQDTVDQAAAKKDSSAAGASAGDSSASSALAESADQDGGAAGDSLNAKNTEASDSTQASVANPYQEVSSLSDAASIAGFSLSVPEADSSYPKQVVNVVNQSMIQVDYTTSDGSDTEYTVRKAQGSNDISGDYNSYANSEQKTVNGATVTLKGNGDTWSVATWTSNGYTYAVDTAGHPMSEDWILEIISDVK